MIDRHEDDLVERLVRLADSGPEMPGHGAQRIKTAIGPLWQREVRARARHRRFLWGAAALAAAAAISFAVVMIPRNAPPPPEARTPLARIELVRGSIVTTPGLSTGSWLHTDGESRAAIRLIRGQALRLDVNTRIRLLSGRVAELDRGAVYIDSDGGQPLEVRTTFGVVRDIGTQFEVRRERELIVRVRTGTVSLMTSTQPLEIRGGTSVTVAIDGSRKTNPIRADALEWEWTQRVAPPFAIEGRPVAALLDWVTREAGLSIRYQDGEAERMARITILHGSLGDLRPDQAPEVILPTAGLQAKRARDALIVSRP